MNENSQPLTHSLALPERDRMYREWILPHLRLEPEDAENLQITLGINDLHGFYSINGSLAFDIDNRVPLHELQSMAPCFVHDHQWVIWGPKVPSILFPIMDPKGRYTAFQLLSRSQLEVWKQEKKPGKLHWWHAPGVSPPTLPDGSEPLYTERGTQFPTTTVITTFPAGAIICARRWGCNAISYPRSIINDHFQTVIKYLQELCTQEILLHVPNTTPDRDLRKWWELAMDLESASFQVHFSFPAWGDDFFPTDLELCARLKPQAWIQEQPRLLQEKIIENKPDPRIQHLLSLQQKRHQTITQQLHQSLLSLLSLKDSLTISALAQQAGVSKPTVRRWLREQGIFDTRTLQKELAKGWRPHRHHPHSDEHITITETGSITVHPSSVAAPKKEKDLFSFSSDNDPKEVSTSLPLTPSGLAHPDSSITSTDPSQLSPPSPCLKTNSSSQEKTIFSDEPKRIPTEEVVIEPNASYSWGQRPLTTTLSSFSCSFWLDFLKRFFHKSSIYHWVPFFILFTLIVIAGVIFFGRRQQLLDSSIPSHESLEAVISPEPFIQPVIRSFSYQEIEQKLQQLSQIPPEDSQEKAPLLPSIKEKP